MATADRLAIAALTAIAADPQLLARFLALTGYRATDIRTAAGEPEFLSGVLHFAARHEPILLAAGTVVGLDPPAVRQLINTLNLD